MIPVARALFDSDDHEEAYNKVLDRIDRELRRCELTKDPEFNERHREFVEYIDTLSWGRRPEHELGFNVPDRQYFAETKSFVEIPEFLLTPRFLHAVSRWETLSEAKSMLGRWNAARSHADQLTYFSYTSRHLGAADNDNSFRRLLILVPGNRADGTPERWVQFGVTDPGARPRVRNVSVVSSVPGPDGTYTTYFKDYFRTFRRDGSITVRGRWELGEGDDNCVQCHKSGVLPIFPVAGSVVPNEQSAVDAVNERFRTYGVPHFGPYLDVHRLGPGLGAGSEASRVLRFGQDFAATKVANAMSCAKCHRPEGLGYLNWPMDATLIESFIKGGPMPLGHTLAKAERDSVYENLIEEYFAVNESNPGILQAWLEGKMR
ncbi:MAG: hypothetical protein ABIP75_10125 [Pyrinomonadaceae bacterium]